MKQTAIPLLAGLILYLVVAGISYAGFSAFGSTSSSYLITPDAVPLSPSAGVPETKVDPSLPKTEVCPLNGLRYTTKEKEEWEKHRPLAVMIENSDDARPQSGVIRADIVYEGVVEGSVTRFMAMFYCNTPFENIILAPIRSARTSFVDWVSEYDALYNHVGGAGRCNDDTVDKRARALCQIGQYGIKDLDQFGIGYPDCYRNPDRLDHPVATEHTMVCFSDNLYKVAAKRGWTNVDEEGISWDENFTAWAFKDEATEADRPATVKPIEVNFTNGHGGKYNVMWEYDRATNVYKRNNGGVPHLDLESKKQLTAKTVIVQVSTVTGPVDGHGHILYATIGGGKAFIFQDGNVTTGTWKKKSRIGRTTFFDASGKEMELNRGVVWIEVLPSEEQLVF